MAERRRGDRVGLVWCAVAALSAPAFGQGTLVEGFDDLGEPNPELTGPPALVARGWTFRNQSQPMGSRGWFAGYEPGSGWPQPHAGAGYLAVTGDSTTSIPAGTVSTWAIVPAVAGQSPGDLLTFYVRDEGGANLDRLEVRYSPSGGTFTGTGVADVGDFGQVLLDLNPVPEGAWTRVQATLPGSGRVALRYRVQVACGQCGSYTGIDSLSVGPPPPPPCNLPPVPAPGQSVTWAAANSPYVGCQDITIPAGATVTIEPGVRLDMQGRTLSIAGTVQGTGTASLPITIRAVAGGPAMIDMAGGGTLDLTHARLEGGIVPRSRMTIRLTDAWLTPEASIYGDSVGDWRPPLVVLTRCTFDHSTIGLPDCAVSLRECTFDHCYALLDRGWADVTQTNTFIGKPLQIIRPSERFSLQPMFVDGVHASGMAGGFNGVGGSGAALELIGGNYHLGPNNVLQGNVWPVEIDGGLLPGSVLPSSGNTNNKVLAANIGRARWSNVGVPYYLARTGESGVLTVDPGVVVEGRPQYGLSFSASSRLTADGLPGSPVVFRGANGQPWSGLSLNSDHTIRSEYVVIENAGTGILADQPHHLQSSILRNNTVGARAGGTGMLVVENSRFQANGTGVRALGPVLADGRALPNSFTGNGSAIEHPGSGTLPATGNWWNSPDGPQTPANPGGTGDPITGAGAAGVSVAPFLADAPDYGSAPPVIRMVDPGYDFWSIQTMPEFWFRPSDRVVLRWSVQGPAPVSQRIEFSPENRAPQNFTVQLAGGLAGSVRTAEVTIPFTGSLSRYRDQFIRIVSTDAQGRETWDATPVLVSSGVISGELQVDAALTGQTLRPGDALPNLTYTGSVSGRLGAPSFEPAVLLEGDGGMLTGVHVQGQGVFFSRTPAVSTDLARHAIRVYETTINPNDNDERWFFAPGYFTIRPHPGLGIAPPGVQLTSPAPGSQWAGGSAVPVAWTADAPEGMRSFDIQGSYDGGQTFRLIARDLPASARAFTWQLPDSGGIPDVRVRVIVRDRRFQNSSSTVSVSIAAGSGSPCYANCDGSVAPPVLNVQDFSCFLQKFAAADPYANCDESVTPPALNVQDFSCFLQKFAAGCR